MDAHMTEITIKVYLQEMRQRLEQAISIAKGKLHASRLAALPRKVSGPKMSRNPMRIRPPFQWLFQNDVCKFESYQPSQAVWSPGRSSRRFRARARRATHRALIRTNLLVWPASQNHLCTRRARASSAPLPSPKPHSRLRHRSPAAPPPHCLPTRFRALALFGRRPPERVARSSLPASENLHTTGLMQCSKQHLYSITSSARSRNDAGIVRSSALAV